MHAIYDSLLHTPRLLSLLCLHQSLLVVRAVNIVDSSASVFTPLLGTDCLVDTHGRNSWPLAPSHVWPPLAITRYRWLAIISDSSVSSV
jgi:hypothetical protein